MSRPAPAPQPDLSSRLLAAVAERDPALAARLGQQWVHRRGLAALDPFLRTALAPSQGQEAAQWLQAQLGLGSAPLASDRVPLEERVQQAEHLSVQANEIDGSSLPALSSRPALFGRMKGLVKQCLEDAIVGVDDDGDQPLQAGAAADQDAAAQDAADQDTVAQGAEPEQLRPFSLVPPLRLSSTPAPAPPSLAALRSWLPDAEHDGRDLPRAS